MVRVWVATIALALILAGGARASEAGDETAGDETAGDAVAKKPNPFTACAEGHDPCVKPHPARVALMGAGFGTLALGAFMTYIVGDRAYTGDPNYLLVGGGLATLLGAAVGQLFSISGREFSVEGAVGPPVFAFGMTPGGWAVDGETVPPIPMVRLSPALQLDRGGSTLRLDTMFGIQAGSEQRTTSFLGEERTLGSHQLRFDIGPELAVALPYPVTQAASAPLTGGLELRYGPKVRVRRYASDNLDDTRDVTERMTLLPLNFGFRWHLSPRQQFELLVGPRWDFQTLSRDGELLLASGAGQANNFYGEIWYRIGIPLSKPDKGPLQVTGELALGYEQWKGDDQALDFGSVVGYLGPLHVDWTLHLRKPGHPVAAHIKAGAVLANGGGAWFEVGLARAPLAATGGES